MDEYILANNFNHPLEIESPIDKVAVLSLQFIPLSGIAEKETLLIIRNITSTYHLDKTRKDFIAVFHKNYEIYFIKLSKLSHNFTSSQ